LKGHVAQKHLKITSEKKTACTEYEASFENKKQFEHHMNSTHLNVRLFKCISCPKWFATESIMKKHYRMTHE